MIDRVFVFFDQFGQRGGIAGLSPGHKRRLVHTLIIASRGLLRQARRGWTADFSDRADFR